MVVRHVTGQPALPYTQVAESEVKDPNRISKQDRGTAVTGQLQSLTELKDRGPSASRQAHATQTGIRAERARVARSVPSTTAVVNSATADASETQCEQLGKLGSLSGQAMAVFDQKPRPSPLRDAQQAFETKFPNVPRPVDLNKIYLNTYEKKEIRVSGNPIVYEIKSSRSIADLVVERYNGGASRSIADLLIERYNGGEEKDFDDDTDKGIYYGFYSSPDALFNGPDKLDIPPQQLERFTDGLPADKAKDVKVQNAQYFSTPGQDGKTPLQKLGEIRKELIQADTDLQDADGTLSKKAQDLVRKITQNPTQTDLKRAYPGESKRPRVYGLSIKPASTTNGKPDPDQTLHGPLVMMTPHADNLPGENDVVVLYLPGQGLKEFDSAADLKNYVNDTVRLDPEQSLALLNFLPEQAQADWSTHQLYELGDFKQVPPGKNFFEYSVQQQLDKQGSDTVYRMTQAKERGVGLTELDGIAGDSSDDLRESFDTDRMLMERDVRLIEHNRPDWWKQSSQENKDLLATYQEDADRFASNLEELESKIPTLNEHAAQKIREELQTQYSDIDPDKVTVTITYYQPPEGQSRANPNPQPRFSTVTTTLTEYVVLERRLAQNPPDDKTGISGTILDMLAPGSDVAKLFRQNTVGVSATVTGADGNPVTLDKTELNALAEKLDVGKRYGQLLTDKYDGANGQHLKTAWKDAYLARMRADAQAAEMSGVFESDSRFSNTKRPFTMVQAALDQPDSRTQERKVDGHTVQTEEFTVDIWGSKPGTGSVRASYPVNGVLVIGAVDSHGNASRALPTVVLYTPDAPDGKAYRVYDDREKLKSDPKFRQPEWIKYFKSRVSHGKVPVSREKEVTRQAGIDLPSGPNPASNFYKEFNTKPVTGNFTDRLYQAEVATKRQDADALSVTNEELCQESLQKKISAGIGLALDVVDIAPFGKLGKGLIALARRVNPRKVLSRLPKGVHFFRKTGGANSVPFGIVRHNPIANLAERSLKGFEVQITRDSLKNLKYDKTTGVYTDGANNQYIRIDSKYYRSNLQPDANGTPQRGVFRPNNNTDRVDVERIGDRWTVLPNENKLRGGIGSETSTTTNSTITQSTQPNTADLVSYRRPDEILRKGKLSATGLDQGIYNYNGRHFIAYGDPLAAYEVAAVGKVWQLHTDGQPGGSFVKYDKRTRQWEIAADVKIGPDPKKPWDKSLTVEFHPDPKSPKIYRNFNSFPASQEWTVSDKIDLEKLRKHIENKFSVKLDDVNVKTVSGKDLADRMGIPYDSANPNANPSAWTSPKGEIYIAWDSPDYVLNGGLDVEKIRSTVVHEYIHAASANHVGLQKVTKESGELGTAPLNYDESIVDYFSHQVYTEFYPHQLYKAGYFIADGTLWQGELVRFLIASKTMKLDAIQDALFRDPSLFKPMSKEVADDWKRWAKSGPRF
ncbi:hypothetical protein WJ47_16810 [Burkholderia ubonensis]|uniref:Dermonecrotic toxin N-terminal domain-containing protein n=1 Tax=Burkholderia ubonensis TaxID=101571 RepID=A0AB73FS34_9BURK|nr:DUF6543 domain-containing protein [Burkholderia ubonensis]KVK72771.1 hypothetical protein WJ44_19785 [Burkholderia ubonensis]KVL62252.1 hypothetical protein WJ47_16810 [Burkholderia ubonensis]KVM22020.1 hypothetical protein WJ53_19380 [Burkholderia ubonensis]KVM33608.1 hypothetical protein WJ54_06715 [Burkholderia ubonensis]